MSDLTEYNRLKKELTAAFEAIEDVSVEELIEDITSQYSIFEEKDIYVDKDLYIDDAQKYDGIDFGAVISFRINGRVPPLHSVSINKLIQSSTNNILLQYQFGYEYVLSIVIAPEILTPRLLKIIRTIFWVNKSRNEYATIMSRKFAKLRFSNELAYWNNLFLISEEANKSYTQEFEDWLNTQLSSDQKIAQSTAYELFWEGIPQEHRHFTITSF